jgi:excisionase family DNA binding protein
MFMSVEQAAKALGFTPSTIRNRIVDGSLRAIQGTPGGAYRIPAMEVEAFKRRNGMLAPLRAKRPSGVVYVDAGRLYSEDIAPVVRELGAGSPEEALRQLREHPTQASRYLDFVDAYAAYMRMIATTGAAG